ncbi:MAG: thioredoxin-disulfide reductase [Spirochaetales bacterium]|nr:thioredoxin-disulfide reductase [Spirochaetales bacterium]
MSDATAESVIIVGSGPAGHTAAIYAARAELKPLLFEGFMAGGVAAGGQLTTTTEIENYPGFPEPVGGPELMMRMREQSLKYGTRINTETVVSADLSNRPFKVRTEEGEFRCDTLIIATGATAKRLSLPGEDEYWQKGISACAVCDGALPVFRDKPLVVIGGGDTACEESSFLSKFGSKIHMLVRRDVMRASQSMQNRVLKNPKISIHWETEPLEAVGAQFLSGVRVIYKKKKKERTIKAAGLFYAIGHTPNTDFVKGQLDMDDDGYLLTEPNSTKTKIPGVFVCGDASDRIFRQAVTAAGTGCMAALESERFLSELG